LRLTGGALVLAVVVWRLGAAPFVEALGAVDARWLVVAVAITVVTTVACAWRWRLVAAAFGVAVPLAGGVAAYYRSQFLNATLPGGVLGDVHRAVRHGQDLGDVRLGLRAVAWERSLGQLVQGVLTVLVLLLVPFPARAVVLGVAGAVLVVGLGLWLLHGTGTGRSRAATLGSALGEDLRRITAVRRGVLGIVLASTVATWGYAAMFVVAAHASGVPFSVARLLPVALVVLLVSAVPTNIAGWGPREGGAAWAFGSVGLGAEQGVTTAVVYGVMALVATLPGAAVLVAVRRRGLPPDARDDAAAGYGPVEAAHG
jgi:uncharacterized membrane protein YbhN (UPF0104 family)